MTLDETLNALQYALDRFRDCDSYLIEKNIAERSLAHKLAEYLQIAFDHFNVDCEYNGDADGELMRKKLIISKDELVEIAHERVRQDETYSVYPDIIVHARGTNENNLLVIEIKKSKNLNAKDKEFDLLKLKKFTEADQLSYRLGLYLEFEVGGGYHEPQRIYFQNGKRVEQPEEFAPPQVQAKEG